MTRTQVLILVLLVLANVVIFVGGAVFIVNGMSISAPASPTAIAISAVSSPATPTPVAPPPTAAPPSPTPTSAVSAAITSAMDKARVASSYRLTMDMTIQGDLGALAPTASPNAELSMLSLTGEVSGKDSHFTLKGLAGVLFTGDASKGMEMTEAGGKSYVHGPLPLLGAKDNRWYVMPAQSGSTAKPATGPGDMLPAFGDPGTDLGRFSRTGTETVDKTRCDVYSADKATALKSFSALANSTELNQGELAALQTRLQDAEFNVWVCDDGYLHQIRMGFTAQDPSSTSKTIGIKLSIHLYDFNTKIAITPPANAAPATLPFITTPTSTAKSSATRTATPTPKK